MREDHVLNVDLRVN